MERKDEEGKDKDFSIETRVVIREGSLNRK